MFIRARARRSLAAAILIATVSAAALAAIPCTDYADYLRHVATMIVEGEQEDLIGYTQLAVKGRKAYAWEYQHYTYVQGSLQVIDLADPAAPVLRGRLEFPNGMEATGLVCIDHFVLLATQSVRVVDVDDHDQPVEVLSLLPGGSAVDLAVKLRRVYVGLGGSAAAVAVWDFDDPLDPVHLVTVPVSGTVHSVAVQGDLLLVGCDGSLDVLSVADPDLPVPLGTVAVTGDVTDVAAQENLAVIEHQFTASLVDLTDPEAPVVVAGPLAGTDNVTSVAVRDGHVWLGCEWWGTDGYLYRFDVSDPSTPVNVGRDALNRWPTALVFAFDHMFAACLGFDFNFLSRGGLEVFAEGDPTSARTGLLDLGPNSWYRFGGSTLAGDWLYVVGETYLGAVSLADPATPTLEGSTWLGVGFGKGGFMAGNHLIARMWYLSPFHYWLQAYDVSDPADPQPRGQVDFGNDGFSAVARDELVYVSGLGGAVGEGIRVYRLDAAGEFDLLGSFWEGWFAAVYCFDGDRAVARRSDEDFALVEFTDPLTPTVLGTLAYDPQNPRIPLVWDGDFVYASRPAPDWDGLNSWEIIDVSDPAAPIELARVYLPPEEAVGDLEPRGEVVYVGSNLRTYVYDASALEAPVLSGTLPTVRVGSAMTLHQHAEALVAVGRFAEIGIWPYQCAVAVAVRDDVTSAPRGFRLTAAPNPFNPRTVLRFALPDAADIELTVFDVRGRRVRNLVAGRFGAGDHAVVWDGRDGSGRDAAAGVYLARLRVDDRTMISRLALVR